MLFGAVAAVLIAVPSDLIDTPIFGRPVEVRWIDYVILAVTSALIGLIFAIRPEAAESSELAEATERQGTGTIWSGFVSFLAVGCPVCNQAVVALVGVGGGVVVVGTGAALRGPAGRGAAALHPAQAPQHLQAHRLPGPRCLA